MKTDDLIRAISADASSRESPIGATLALSLAVGALVGAVIFQSFVGIRQDFAHVMMNSWEFALKIAFTLAVLAPALAMAFRLARPDGDASSIASWLLLPAAIVLPAMAYDLLGVGAANIDASVFSPNWTRCVMLIPLLSLTPLAAVLFALKRGAPANPTAAGLAGGLLAGAFGAVLYASHCDSDNPMFVGVWYTLGIAAITAVGGLIGSRLLRW